MSNLIAIVPIFASKSVRESVGSGLRLTPWGPPRVGDGVAVKVGVTVGVCVGECVGVSVGVAVCPLTHRGTKNVFTITDRTTSPLAA